MIRALVVAALLALSCAPSTAHAPGPPPVPRNGEADLGYLASITPQIFVTCIELVADPATLSVSVAVQNWSGSGVYIGPHPTKPGEVVATAAHVVSDMHDGCVIRANEVYGSVLSYDAEADVALLHIPTSGHGALSPSRLYLGQPIIAMGYPLQPRTGETGFQVSRGYLIHWDGERYRGSASFWFGSSGGPSFDEYGNLVGLNVSVLAAFGQLPIDDMYFITPAEHVFRLYGELK